MTVTTDYRDEDGWCPFESWMRVIRNRTSVGLDKRVKVGLAGSGSNIQLWNETPEEERYTTNLTVNDLKEQWIAQDGRCTFSNVEMRFLGHYEQVQDEDRATLACLELIDDKQDYVKGNFHWISVLRQNEFFRVKHAKILQEYERRKQRLQDEQVP